MQIQVIGHISNLDELKQKFGPEHKYLFGELEEDISELMRSADVVFDFHPEKSSIKARYSNFSNPVFLNTSLISLAELIGQSDFLKYNSFFGFCGLPTFVNRPVLEACVSSKMNEPQLENICSQLVTDFVCVEDLVGLVTPRVICMVINEAYYTLEEGTATRDDIDLAMKLGTNYPFGPFEWARRIGISHVTKLLDAVYHDTSDNRYKVCDLLRSEINN
jgi:3-hydroxybutyryl-CoA dehydrogenase